MSRETVLLKHLGNNQVMVRVNNVEMFFSYEACIAFDASESHVVLEHPRMFNPAYRGYSRTTSKHAGEMGVTNWPNAENEATFNACLKQALG